MELQCVGESRFLKKLLSLIGALKATYDDSIVNSNNMMTDVEYLGFIIKLKYFSEYNECLVAIRDACNKTIVSEWLCSVKEAEDWAKKTIDSIQQN